MGLGWLIDFSDLIDLGWYFERGYLLVCKLCTYLTYLPTFMCYVSRLYFVLLFSSGWRIRGVLGVGLVVRTTSR